MIRHIALAACLLTAGCGSLTSTVPESPAEVVEAVEAPVEQTDYLALGKQQGYEAAVAAQNATDNQWYEVSQKWDLAVRTLGQVPADNPNYATAQDKITEYNANRDVAAARHWAYQAEAPPAETPQTINPEPSPQSEEMTAEDYYQQGVDRYVSEQDSQGAVESFTKAIELDPNHALAYYNRGVAKLRLDDPEGAKADLTKAREIYASRGDENGVYQADDRLQQIKEKHGI